MNTNTWGTKMELNDGLSLWAHITCTAAPFTVSIFFPKLNWCSTFNITIKVNSLLLQLSWLIEFQGSDKYSTSSQQWCTLTQSNPLGATEMHSLSEQKGKPSWEVGLWSKTFESQHELVGCGWGKKWNLPTCSWGATFPDNFNCEDWFKVVEQ